MTIVPKPTRGATGNARAPRRVPNMYTALPAEELFYALASVPDVAKLRKLWRKAWDKAGGDKGQAIQIMRMMVDINVWLNTATVSKAPTSAQRVIRQHLELLSLEAWDKLCAEDPDRADAIAKEIVEAVDTTRQQQERAA